MTFAKQMKWSFATCFHRTWWGFLAIAVILLMGMVVNFLPTTLLATIISGSFFYAGAAILQTMALILWIGIAIDYLSSTATLEKGVAITFLKKINAKWLVVFFLNAVILLLQYVLLKHPMNEHWMANANVFGMRLEEYLMRNIWIYSPSSWVEVPCFSLLVGLCTILSGCIGKSRKSRIAKTILLFMGAFAIRYTMQLVVEIAVGVGSTYSIWAKVVLDVVLGLVCILLSAYLMKTKYDAV